MHIGTRGYYVPLAALSAVELRQIQRELTVRPILTVEFQKPKAFPVYEMAPPYLIVPRAWGIRRFGDAPYHGRMGVPATVDRAPSFQLDASRSQPDAVRAVLDALVPPHAGGLLCLYTGAGKTVIANWIISELRTKTLIVVHKTFLLAQWRERLAQFLPRARVTEVQGPRVDVGGDVVIGMLQSLSMKEYPDDTFDDFGLVIFDECHLINTRVFQKAIKCVTTRYMLGLTATPERKDRLERVMQWHLGECLFTAQRVNMTATVELVYAEQGAREEIVNPRTRKPDRVAMVTEMVACERRNAHISDVVCRAAVSGRKTLVLSERRAHLAELRQRLADALGEESVGLYVGGMTEASLRESERCRVILGSYSMASTGLDIPGMSALVLATPLTDVRQASGRILRNVTQHDKRIYDVVDRYSLFVGQMRRRIRDYHAQGFTVTAYGDGAWAVEEASAVPRDLGDGCLIADEA